MGDCMEGENSAKLRSINLPLSIQLSLSQPKKASASYCNEVFRILVFWLRVKDNKIDGKAMDLVVCASEEYS